jgi:hypothetical protein
MPMVAQQTPYTLFIVDDNEPMNPRENNDNFGKMFCWHKRYNLGDDHDYNAPDDFLIDLCDKTVPKNEIFQMIIDSKFENIRVEPDEENIKAYHVKSYSDYFDKWYIEETYETPPLDISEEIVDISLQFLKNSELLRVLRNYNVILPLYLYDHSGISMNTAGFSCPWDSGQVGWIYVGNSMIENEYGTVTPETIAKAENVLKSEVELYDYFLSGQCYGFKLYEGDNKIINYWGFFGSIVDMPKNIKEYLPSECENIIEFLQYESDINEDEYLEQTLNYENEDEEDMEI